MDDISDQMNIAEEISEAISNPVGGALDDDVRWFVFFACCVLLADKLGCFPPLLTHSVLCIYLLCVPAG